MGLEETAGKEPFDHHAVFRRRRIVGNQITRLIKISEVTPATVAKKLHKQWGVKERTALAYIRDLSKGRYTSTPCLCPRDPDARLYSPKDTGQLRDIFRYLRKTRDSLK